MWNCGFGPALLSTMEVWLVSPVNANSAVSMPFDWPNHRLTFCVYVAVGHLPWSASSRTSNQSTKNLRSRRGMIRNFVYVCGLL